MIPYGLKTDKEGLLYIDSKEMGRHEYLSLDQRKDKSEYYASYFYRIPGSDDYIIKQSVTILDRKHRNNYMEMLMGLVDRQKNIHETEFPIGYLREHKKLAALIIRYYKNGISLDNIVKEKDLNLIGKYYSHDEDNIHNLFILFDEVLNALYEMFENGVNYTDINPGNLIINDNKVKIIDFDPVYVTFKEKDKKLPIILERYFKLLQLVLNCYGLSFRDYDIADDFEEAKTYIKKIENNLQRNR